MKKLFLFSIICIMLCGCNSKEEIDIEKIMSENEYIIVDVRTIEEYNEGHLVDAINIPYDEIDGDDLDKNKVIFVYCATGIRSEIAYNNLKKLGYTVYDLWPLSDINLPKE